MATGAPRPTCPIWQVVGLCEESSGCRRALLLSGLGQASVPASCAACDNCLASEPPGRIDVTLYAAAAVRVVSRMSGKLSFGQACNHHV